MSAEEREDWDGGWEAHRRAQRRAWLELTPDQRLAWLDDAIDFALEVGALPRRTRGITAERRLTVRPDPTDARP